MKRLHLIIYIICLAISAKGQSSLTMMSFNCENAFDLQHDEGKNDYEYLPDGSRRWSMSKLWYKLDGIAKVIAATDVTSPVGLVALCEVENDSVLDYLTKRSALRTIGYDYVMTQSQDSRGIDVAVLYSSYVFHLIGSESVSVKHVGQPTRDILHLWGTIAAGDTLDVYAVHLPSKLGGKEGQMKSMQVVEGLCSHTDSVFKCRQNGKIVVMGDFNADYKSKQISKAFNAGLFWSAAHKDGKKLYDVVEEKVPKGLGTYKYKGVWSVIDHILVSGNMNVIDAGVLSLPFLLEDDQRYGGKKPRRTYVGYRYNGGISDHLPVWVRINR